MPARCLPPSSRRWPVCAARLEVAPAVTNVLVSYFQQGDVLRSRSVSPVVHTATLDVPAPPARLVADWERDICQQLDLAPGDVEPLNLARTRARWPDVRHCVQAATDWATTLNMPRDLLPSSDIALMTCRGARYHHDAAQYGGAAFLNLFLSDDKGLDLHFPQSGRRIPLVRGTVVLFDTGQPHAVIARHRSGFDAADFPAESDCTLVFLTWELAIDTPEVARTLGITFKVDPEAADALGKEQLQLNGAAVQVCPATGRFF